MYIFSSSLLQDWYISIICNGYLREKYLYLEFFWPVFSHVRTEYGEILNISPYSIRMQENKDQKSSKYGHFSHGVCFKIITIMWLC